MSSPARRYLLLGLAAVSTPSPTPSPIDSTTLGEQQLAYFDELGTSIKLAVEHALVFTMHALLLAAEVAVAVGLIVLAVRLGTPWLRHAMNRRPMAGIRILPPTDSAFQSEAWVACFRALYAIARPWWKSWLVGQPSVVFEYRASAGRVPVDSACEISKGLPRRVYKSGEWAAFQRW